MQQERRRLLDKHLLTFCQDLDVDDVAAFLISQSVFTDTVLEKITACPTSTKSRQTLLRAVKERGDVAFDMFYLGLVNSRQEHLASLLRPLVSETVFQSLENRENAISHNTSCKLSVSTIKDNFELELNGLIKDLKVEEVDGNTAQEQLKFYEDNSECYPNFTSPKGLCLLINNEQFETMGTRKGTQVDKTNVSNLFTQLGYKVIVRENLKAMEMMQAITDFARDPLHLRCSSVIVIVLTHGEHDILLGCDDQTISTHNFASALNSVNSPHLAGKPKLFFIQACRGERYDRGIATTETDGTSQPDAFRLFSCVMGKTEKAQSIRRLPAEADFLLAFATPPHFVSWRNSERGSWFIQAICQIFSRHAQSSDVVEMLTMVNEKVSQNRTARSEMQIPDFSCRLRKKFFFFPGVTKGTPV